MWERRVNAGRNVSGLRRPRADTNARRIEIVSAYSRAFALQQTSATDANPDRHKTRALQVDKALRERGSPKAHFRPSPVGRPRSPRAHCPLWCRRVENILTGGRCRHRWDSLVSAGASLSHEEERADPSGRGDSPGGRALRAGLHRVARESLTNVERLVDWPVG